MVTLDQGGRGRPSLQLIAPVPALREVVEFFWTQLRAEGRGWRIVADDAPSLIGQVTPSGSRLVLVGARTRFIDIDVSGRLLTVGARLRPGAIPALFGVPSDAFTDRAYMLGDVLGREPAEVADTLAVGEARPAVASLAAFLIARTARARSVDPRIAALVRMDGQEVMRVSDAAQRLGVPERTIRDLSRRHLGMGAKRLWRIRRLHRAVRLGLARPCTNWARVAAETGYADQSHLIRDCRALLGETPSTFVARAH